jgi:hypothetical protein
MAVSPEDIAAGALALQVFVKNAKNVEIIVGVAFAVIPTILGIGAAGLLGSGIINTAKEIRNSVSLLRGLTQLSMLKGRARLKSSGKGGGDKPPTPAPAPATAAMAASAGRENPERKTSTPIILQPPNIKIPDKGEGRNPDKGEERGNPPP